MLWQSRYRGRLYKPFQERVNKTRLPRDRDKKLQILILWHFYGRRGFLEPESLILKMVNYTHY